MIESAITEAFVIDGVAKLQKLSSGLINLTYKLTDRHGKNFLLQKINTQVFATPKDIQHNYWVIQQHLKEKNSFHLPDIIFTYHGEPLFTYNGIVWRCFEYITETYSPSVSSSADEAWRVANCFGKFSAELSDLDPKSLAMILPRFHDLEWRFNQLIDAVKQASVEKIKEAKPLIESAIEYKKIVSFYNEIVKSPKQFPLHILHHDCKIANILFHLDTNEIYTPIDLDTTQSGLYFSDLGDMIRSIVPNLSENDSNTDDLFLRKDFYQAVRDGYLHAMQDFLTQEELQNIDMSGKIVTYMQALRFLTDYLNGDIYYHTDYLGQNKDRADNQFQLLFLLDNYTKDFSKQRNLF